MSRLMGEPENKPSRIPSEIRDVMKRKQATMMVKGLPGAGKTTLALELAMKAGNAIIVTSGQSQQGLESRFPWIAGLGEKIQVLDVSAWFEGDGIGNTTLAERVRVLGIQVAEHAPGFLLVFDDLQSFLFGLPRAEFAVQARMFLDHIAVKFNNPVIYILEIAGRADAAIESRVDCIVELQDTTLEGRPMRWLAIEKIAGAPRLSNVYPFTLRGGRFTIGKVMDSMDPKGGGSWTLAKDPVGSYSTGSEEIDALYRECLKLASFNLFELDPTLPVNVSSWFLSAVINFLKQGRGVIMAPLMGINTSIIKKKDFMLFVDAETLESYFRLIEEKTSIIAENRPYVVSIAHRDRELFKTFNELYDHFASKTNYAPVLSVIEYTSLDYQDPELARDLLKHIKFVKNANIIEVAIVNSGVNPEFKALLSSLSDSHVRLKPIETGVTLFTSMRPWAHHFFVELASRAQPKIRLLEII